MESKEILIAPRTDAIIPAGVVDKPSVCGALYFTPMKMIKDLGFILSPSGKFKRHYAIYECPLCKKHFKSNHSTVSRGIVKSCSCSSIIQKKHGLWNHPLHAVWSGMKARCSSPNHHSFKYYGENGIKVCDEWASDFLNFYNWSITNGYKKGLCIERKNNDKGYSPNNCRFTNYSINNQNTRLLQSDNSSGYRGVFYHKRKKDSKKWMAKIGYNGKFYYLGYYTTAKEAAKAFNEFVIKHRTFHPFNIIDE